MTDRQQQVIYFIESYHGEDECTAKHIINHFSKWYKSDIAENLGLFLTKMVRQKLIEVVDGRYRIYDNLAHSEDAEPENDDQLSMF